MIEPQPLDESEIDVGRALTASIRALQQNIAALMMAEQMFIDSLRQKRGLGPEWQMSHWEKGFEDANKDSQ
mgnify:FL=1